MRNRPEPAFIVLTDRADGTPWRLHHDWTRKLVGITDEVLSRYKRANIRFYPALEEPVLGTNPTIRLIVRSGRLGYSVESMGQGVTDRDVAEILTRLPTPTRNFLQINRGSEARYWRFPGDTLGYTEFEE